MESIQDEPDPGPRQKKVMVNNYVMPDEYWKVWAGRRDKGESPWWYNEGVD
ncbi:hypothetical protein Ddye_002278 [Dipteronia dyeriana]|uniref:Uncharacterized protein n=1 Tax=Dipteronia dyeriana TaxID=168575 RepID=A0AAD9XQ39_9ROSI|nr:hypothetical protein Ddye_002278 [Dipteronia dyeriana]